jgi:hypothetical protein
VISIEALFLDISLNSQRHQVPNRFPLFYSSSYFRGRNRDIREFNKKDPGTAPVSIVSLFKIITKELFYSNASAAERIAVLTARARSHNEIAERKNLGEILPRSDFPKCIKTNNEKQRIAVSFSSGEMANRIDGIGNAGPEISTVDT